MNTRVLKSAAAIVILAAACGQLAGCLHEAGGTGVTVLTPVPPAPTDGPRIVELALRPGRLLEPEEAGRFRAALAARFRSAGFRMAGGRRRKEALAVTVAVLSVTHSLRRFGGGDVYGLFIRVAVGHREGGFFIRGTPSWAARRIVAYVTARRLATVPPRTNHAREADSPAHFFIHEGDLQRRRNKII